MYIDKQLRLSNAQVLTGTSETDSTNTVDFSVARELSVGNQIAVRFQIDSALSGTSPTLTIKIKTSANNTNWTDLVISPTINSAPAGTVFTFFLPMKNVSRYLKATYTMGGTSPTCTITADVMPANTIEAWTAYSAGYSIE